MLTPGRYVGAEESEDDGEFFEEKMTRLTATLSGQMVEAAGLDEQNRTQLVRLGHTV